ncbi:LysR family transcriptional regulator [Primorskyibacter aestuariivivens]|uniref:LysR family transcriptional regulator n=1 Tax=Primorskyibacter aestuariivivens TaxID=1888912 RepID=UPI00230138E8|nr:LysR family transcriptional regulator [Primorskyibacter aestuariivivens]MDA7428923.1 LysR family transcriptional regulator [Primorskyibacter aestuariivivens]
MQNRFRDWGDVRIFLAVLREGSTLAAARVLGINQTTVARRIDVMEHVLGLALFTKSTRGACPTDAALRLQPLAEALEQAALALEEAAQDAQQTAAPPIRITALDNDLIVNIAQVVAEFSSSHPGISFEFIATERVLDLIKGDADVAVRMSSTIKDDRLIARNLGETGWTYYASRSYAEKHGTPDAYTPNMEPHRVGLLSHIISHRRNVLRCASGHDLMLAIRSGQCIGPMTIFVGDNDPELVRCFDPPEGSRMNLWLLTSPEAYKRADVRAFLSYAAPRLKKRLKGVLY